MSANFDAILLLPHLRIQNANAISGPFSWGFPAPTAFTGFVHALSRRLTDDDRVDVTLEGAGIVCHDFSPQTDNRFVRSFCLTRNPLTARGESAPFVEEGRAHLEISLIIGVRSEALLDAEDEQLQLIAERILRSAESMRIAGGSILPAADQSIARPELFFVPDELAEMESLSRRVRRRILPGFALVTSEARLREHLEVLRDEDPAATTMDALVDFAALQWECDESGGRVQWRVRSHAGWLVPLPIGYAAISPLYEPGAVRGSRDPAASFRFVESIYSLGQWLSPHRVRDLRDLLWLYHADPEAGLYRCVNDFSTSLA